MRWVERCSRLGCNRPWRCRRTCRTYRWHLPGAYLLCQLLFALDYRRPVGCISGCQAPAPLPRSSSEQVLSSFSIPLERAGKSLDCHCCSPCVALLRFNLRGAVDEVDERLVLQNAGLTYEQEDFGGVRFVQSPAPSFGLRRQPELDDVELSADDFVRRTPSCFPLRSEPLQLERDLPTAIFRLPKSDKPRLPSAAR